MLHDVVMSRTKGGRSQADETGGFVEPFASSDVAERRSSDRVPYPAELVLAWTHDLKTPMRYQVIDAGDGGYRIHSSMPLLEGTTGMALRLLPGRGRPLDQPVMVAWVSRSSEGEGYEVGLRLF